ncbi:MAG: phosphotransferase [Gammaproteobacteria bacterium]|nr:phosphotransferase [Gammaproteobacteria bacterium]
MKGATEVIDRARELLPDARQIEVIEYLEGGWSNRNYVLRVDGVDAVLRLKNPQSVAPDREYMYLENPLAPEVLAYDRTRGDMVTGFVQGELLVNSPITPEVAATYMLELHSKIPGGIRTYRVEPIIDGYLKGLRLSETLESIYHSLRWEPQRLCGCHNELNDWNVIKTPTGFCTLDWESAGDNDPIFDVVGLCYGLEFGDTDFERCISGYDPHFDAEHVRRTRILYQIREHAWALDRLRHGSDHEGIVKQKYDTEIEIQRLVTGRV